MRMFDQGSETWALKGGVINHARAHGPGSLGGRRTHDLRRDLRQI